MNRRFVPVLAAFFLLCADVRGHEQFAAVKGKLLCGAQPAANVVVKLYDIDTAPDPHDLLDSDRSDMSGEFHLRGSTDEPTNIEPVLRIYTDCNDDKVLPGLRKITFNIPYEFVSGPGEVPKYFDMGLLQLEDRFEDEEREVMADKRRRHNHHRYNRLTYDTEADFFEGL
ncbi:Transthyretin-like protein 46 [Aphelenchoides fujianensis]|nr:Transthyretin-like protein 46 [Aphelenchoides fujianensis]